MHRAETRKKRRRLLRQAQGEIRRRYRDPDLALQEVADTLGISARQLQLIFQDEAGESFRDHLLRIRWIALPNCSPVPITRCRSSSSLRGSATGRPADYARPSSATTGIPRQRSNPSRLGTSAR